MQFIRFGNTVVNLDQVESINLDAGDPEVRISYAGENTVSLDGDEALACRNWANTITSAYIDRIEGGASFTQRPVGTRALAGSGSLAGAGGV